MMNATLFHGTSTAIGGLQARRSWCVAAYTTPSPGLAALYGGAGGYVYGYDLVEGANVLEADGGDQDTWHYMTGDEYAQLRQACAAAKVDFDGLMQQRDQNAPPRRNGLPCWEEVTRFHITPARRTKVFQALGYDGIRYRELALAVHGDLMKRGSIFNEPFAYLCREELGSRFSGSPVSVATFDPKLLVQVADPMPAEEVAREVMAGSFGLARVGPAI